MMNHLVGGVIGGIGTFGGNPPRMTYEVVREVEIVSIPVTEKQKKGKNKYKFNNYYTNPNRKTTVKVTKKVPKKTEYISCDEIDNWEYPEYSKEQLARQITCQNNFDLLCCNLSDEQIKQVNKAGFFGIEKEENIEAVAERLIDKFNSSIKLEERLIKLCYDTIEGFEQQLIKEQAKYVVNKDFEISILANIGELKHSILIKKDTIKEYQNLISGLAVHRKTRYEELLPLKDEPKPVKKQKI